MVLQILGIMLAFQTRRVKIKSLKDSTFVAANVYISSIVIVMFILVTFVLRSYLNAYSAIFATGIFILTTTFLMLTFVPKVYNIITHALACKIDRVTYPAPYILIINLCDQLLTWAIARMELVGQNSNEACVKSFKPCPNHCVYAC